MQRHRRNDRIWPYERSGHLCHPLRYGRGEIVAVIVLETEHKFLRKPFKAHCGPGLLPGAGRVYAGLTQSCVVLLLGKHLSPAGSAGRTRDEPQLFPALGAQPVIGGD